ncbi:MULTISPECIES: hypothetical protein [unclassified Pseudomonas]|uniref:hypothetical protein n=1 Tax=unclassified Pseudomonas TaxID=196821 RepID=UPI00244D1E07|nr:MULTISPECIES: hypothetical protein [unclassified Pseudomonas]MDH0302282.1 hypothetical protein [Pseudomonas sp. GD04091]MDH1985987.1 hypothetical protein [Pseudomonas sp. GD03689]
MSELKKAKIIVKNYDAQNSSEIDALYTRVRVEDEQGKAFYYKQVVVPTYLRRHGALVTDSPRTWYYKHSSKKSIIIVAVEKSDGKVEYDFDDLRIIARSTLLKGILMSVAAIPMGVIAATATFGLGLILIPMAFWYSYRNIFKLPGLLSRKKLVGEFAAYGVTVK